MRILKSIQIIGLTMLLSACLPAQQHAQNVSDAQGDKLTVGTVQTKISKGMSGGAVAEALGSPNIVSTDEQGREVWIYDKISTMEVVSTSSGGLTLGAIGVGPAVGGGGFGGFSSGSGARSRSQKTLTVIIKFDGNKRVRDYAYHYSSF